MSSTLATALQFDPSGLARAVRDSAAYDRLSFDPGPVQWKVLAEFIRPFGAVQGQVIIEQGVQDRTLYLVESGSLSVHHEDDKGRVRLAMVAPGSVVGEGAFFSHLTRIATVQAATPSKLWVLSPQRYSDLCSQHASLALQFTQALGAVLALRLVNRPKRHAVT
jgi:CRP/FNR family transcriptional regulator, cyclic AMP receptor protein